MRRAIYQRQRTESGGQVHSFLEVKSAELVHRQPLVFCLEDSSALNRHAHGKFSHPQPVDGLTEVGDHSNVHLAEQAAQIFRSEIGVVIKKLPGNTRAAHSANVGGKNFSLQFGIEQIPVGLVLVRVDQLSVISG